MKVQEVILRAVSGEVCWIQAAQHLGSDRSNAEAEGGDRAGNLYILSLTGKIFRVGD